MALKKPLFLSLFLSITLSLVLLIVYISPLNLDIYLEQKTRFYEANEPLELSFKHIESSHPYLDVLAISSVEVMNEDKKISLEVMSSDTMVLNDDFYLTVLTMDSPFITLETPFIIKDATLIFRIQDKSLSFEMGTVGFFSETPVHSDLIQVLYGFYENDTPSLNGIYITLNNAMDASLDNVKIGDFDVAVSQVFQTSDPYVPQKSMTTYQRTLSHSFESGDKTYIIPFESESILEKVPLTLTFKRNMQTFEIYLPPFSFIKSQPFLPNSPLVKGGFSD